ncbi:MAG: hypothetical protein ACRC18_07185 [Cetobacterium sp.]
MAAKKTSAKDKVAKTEEKVAKVENDRDLELEALKKQLEELQKQVVAKENVVDEACTKVSKSDLRQNSKRIEVEVLNMTNGEFFYKCKKTHEELNLMEKGDSDVVSLDFLLTMKNSHRTLLERLDLVVLDVYGDYELSDILNYLGLDKIYEFEKLDVDFIENAINDMEVDEFENLVNNSNIGIVVKIAERCIQLANENKFESYSKRQILTRKFGKDDLFEI